MKKNFWVACLFVSLALIPISYGEEAAPELNWTAGPKTVSVGDDLAQLNISKKHLFLNGENGNKLLKYLKQPAMDNLVGMVVQNAPEKDWAIYINYDPMGYVKDDDAKDLDVEALLKSISEGTEESNQERIKLGGEAIHVMGWSEKPHYDKQSHHLVWSILYKTDNGVRGLNYNIRVLGRGGVTSILLSTAPEKFSTFKPEIENIVAHYSYVKGKTYADFIPGKDKVAEIGLAALILGGTAAAAKTGIITKIFLFLMVALKKIWFIGIVGLYAAIKAFFGAIFKSPAKKAEDLTEATPLNMESSDSSQPEAESHRS